MSSLHGARTKSYGNQETMLIKTIKGREIEADLVVRILRQICVKLFSSFSFGIAPRAIRRTASLHGSNT